MRAVQELPPRKLAERIAPDGAYAESNGALERPEELRRRMTESGYLFFRALLNRDALAHLRGEILELCREHGWLREGAPLLDGVFADRPFPNERTEYNPLYRKLIRLDAFNAFSRSPEIMSFFANLLQGEILAHPRNIARISFPRNYDHTTQPHQDFFYIRGSTETYTAWIPCGDCPRELGGLALLEGSHAQGFLPHVPAIGAGNNGLPLAGLRGRWLSADYRLGDVVFFHSHTIHGALDNHSPDRLRISLDFRYQRAGLPVDPSSLRLHLE